MTMNAQQIAKGLDPDFETTGSGFKCRCPSHNDNHPSLHISDGKDGKVLVHCHTGCDPKSVIDELKKRDLWPAAKRAEKAQKAARKTKAKIAKVYDYVDPETGEVRFQVCRMEPKDFRQRRPDPSAPSGWTWSVKGETLIPYNLLMVAQKNTVLVVEGEKDVDRLASMDIAATCNPAGAGKWRDSYSNWLAGKHVIVVPDNDPQAVNPKTKDPLFYADGRPVHVGQDHMDVVAHSLQGIAKSVRILRLPDLPPKGDISDWLDAGGDRAQLAALLSTDACIDWKPPFEGWTPAANVAARPKTPSPEANAVDPDEIMREGERQASNDNAPFRCLGYDQGTFYYMPDRALQVVALSASAHTKNNLLSVAPMRWWEREFPHPKGGVEWDIAADAMMHWCYERGRFDPLMRRGRGAWLDQGRIVVHCGDMLYVDRTPTDIMSVQSRFVYELDAAQMVNIDDPLSVAEAGRFVKLMRMAPWSREIDALYAAGWCVASLVSGVLNWRPHIWIVGAKGTGKTHVTSQMIEPALGQLAMKFDGGTSEAGIRQTIGCHAVPVVLDEAEGETKGAAERIQTILSLARGASAGARITKGTTGGTAKSYEIRSCFMFSSVIAGIVQQSDASRITVLEVRKDRQRHTLDELLAAEVALFTDDYVQRFAARAIHMAPTIRENARTFAAAVASVMGEQRAGDQLGTLLAGAYSLLSDDVITLDDARAWVAKQDWTDQVEDVKGQSDEQACFDYLMQQIIPRVPTVWGDKDMPVGQLVDWARGAGRVDAENIPKAQDALLKMGMKIDGGRLIISNNHAGIERLLRDKPQWSKWNLVLKRLPNAEASKQGTTFGSTGTFSKFVSLQLTEMVNS